MLFGGYTFWNLSFVMKIIERKGWCCFLLCFVPVKLNCVCTVGRFFFYYYAKFEMRVIWNRKKNVEEIILGIIIAFVQKMVGLCKFVIYPCGIHCDKFPTSYCNWLVHSIFVQSHFAVMAMAIYITKPTFYST